MIDPLSRIIPEIPWDSVERLDGSTLDRALLDALNRVAGDEDFDLDKLVPAGIALRKKGPAGADVTVVRWLLRSPSARTLEVAGSVLAGLWHPGLGERHVDPGAVKGWMLAPGGLELDESSTYNHLMILGDALAHDLPDSVRQEAMSAVFAARDSRFEQPELRAGIERLAASLARRTGEEPEDGTA